MPKYIAERHFSTNNGIVKPGEEIEIAKENVTSFKEKGYITDVPKKTGGQTGQTAKADADKTDNDSDK